MQSSIQRTFSVAALAGAFAFAVAGCGTDLSNPISASTNSLSANGLRPGTPAQTKVLGLPFSAHAQVNPTANRRASWMSPDAKKAKSLLYVADEGANDVLVYTYPAGKLMGTLTGFETPTGICSNKAGDVFILNGNGTTVEVYAHGGSSPLRTLDLPGYPYFNCSVDPTTGNLALGVLAGSCGDCIAVFTNASGTPTTYSPSGQNGFPGCGYDNKGNLFCDAYGSSNNDFALYEVAAGSNSATLIPVSGASGLLPGSMQWDGKNLAFSASDAGTLYQVAVSGSTGSVVGSTTLDGTGNVWQFWLTNTSGKKSKKERVIAPTDGSAGALVGYWKYPAGGTATQTITGFSYPDGVAVSTKK